MMRERQRQLAEQGDSVIEGRDIGEIVAPHAELKIWLYADPEVRARAGTRSGTGWRSRCSPTRCGAATSATRRTPIAPATRSSSTRRSSTSSRSIDRIEGLVDGARSR